ncbi:MAG: hypothetical protein ACRD8Z_12835, partial [Nitrososphaeraceae archaeon]
NEKRDEKYNSYHSYLYNLVGRLLDDDYKQRSQNIIQLKSYDVWSSLKNELEGSEIPYRPLSYESAEFGTLSQKGIAQTLIDVLGAKPPKRHGSSRVLIFDKSKFDRQRKLYDLKEIKIKQKKRKTTDEEDGTDGTDGTQSGGISTDSSQPGNIVNKENDEGNNKNYEVNESPSNNNDNKETVNASLLSHNASHMSHVSQNNKETIYRTSDDSDLFACTECKVRGDKWAMQAHSCSTKKKTSFDLEMNTLESYSS